MFFFLTTLESQSDKDFILALYHSYYRLMRYQIVQITSDTDSADDLVQDSIVKLIAKIDLLKLLTDNQRLVYCVKTAKYTALDDARRHSLRAKNTSGEDAESVADSADTPEDAYMNSEFNPELASAISRLPTRDQDLLYFKYRLDLSTEELCTVLQISPQSIHQCLSRARKRVYRRLLEGGYLYGK